MANPKKSAAQAAAQQKAAPQQSQEQNENFAKMVQMSQGGLSGDGKVMLAHLIDKRWVNNPNMPAAVTDGANVLVDSLMADVIVTNIAEGKEIFALIVRNDEQKYLSIKATLGSMGISTPEFNALPAPSQEMLDKANVKLLPADAKVITVEKKNVSKEAIEQKKAELDNEKKKPTTDPTKIESTEQLKESLLALLTSATTSPDKRIQSAINFLSSYKHIQANKAENKEEELKKVDEMSRSALLREIIEIVGKCPFAINGIGKMLFGTVVDTGSPISAFCLYRRNSTNDKGKVAHTDDFIADIVKMIVVWAAKTNIEAAEKTISELERSVKNKKAKQADVQPTIDAKKADIELSNTVMEIMNNPTMTVADSLLTAFNDKENADAYKVAHRLVKNIKDTYYKGIKEDDSNKDAILKNCQQHAGVILNLFRDGLDSNPAYAIANLIDIPEAKEQKEDEGEQPAGEGEEPKNE